MTNGINIKFLYKNLPINEKVNVITHGTGLLLSVLLCPLLLFSENLSLQFLGLCVFTFGLIFMFFSSTFYHLANKDVRKNRWRVVDHISIFFLIGGTYTPFILFYYNTKEGLAFLLLHWMIIAGGVLFKLIFKTKYEIISLVLYLVLGWMILFIYDEISKNMTDAVKFCLMAGGLSYTIGVFFYVKTSIQWNHAIWHILVILGGAGHFIALLLS
ncbi:MAG: hemolysin III family protein [Saprospiraceae bacterium]|nr:hemolysin III family protein [Saprospiraceae bacterium]